MHARLAIAAIGFLTAAAIAPALAQETVVVATRVIYPGETVSADLLEQVTLRRGAQPAPSVALDVTELDGKVARRTILPRRYIPLSSIREPYLVERGKPTQVVMNDGGLTISITAVPLESGSAGDQIRIRNVDSGVVFNGTVLADGTVRVGAS